MVNINNEIDSEFIIYLLENKANPNERTQIGTTPLMMALFGDYNEISIAAIKLLCDYGADPRMKCQIWNRACLDDPNANDPDCEVSKILKDAALTLKEKELGIKLTETFCIVCNCSNRHKKLYQCSRCKGPERYCGRQCQLKCWAKHKSR